MTPPRFERRSFYTRLRFAVACLSILFVTDLCSMDRTGPNYPPTRSEAVSDQVHGVTVPDPYRWLEDSNSGDVREWTERQNELTRKILDSVPGRDKLRSRLDQLLEIGTLSAPQPAKGHYFYTRRE